MNHGRQPAGWGPVRVGAHALAIFAVAALGTGGVAFATGPNAGGAPPEHAQGDGKPEAPPAAQQAPAPSEEGQAKQPSTPATEVQSGGDAHGMTGGGHSKARGKGHTGSTGQSKSGSGTAKANAGKTTICHATGSETNPYVTITVSNNALPAHRAHQNGEDISPAPGGVCPGGSENGGGPDNQNGKVTICHATGSETNPYVVITISENAVEAHRNHQNGEDIIPAPGGVCPSRRGPPDLRQSISPLLYARVGA